MQRLKNQSGTTLVELIVCMVLLALFTLAAVTLIQPSAQAYMDIQQQTRAQNLADALIETIRGEVMDANGYIRFTNGDATGSNLDTVFDKQSSYSDGTALEFSIYPNHIELIDKDCVPGNLQKEDSTVLLDEKQAAELNGYLHMRFYRDSRIGGKYGNPQGRVGGWQHGGHSLHGLRLHDRLCQGRLHGAVHQRPAFLRPQLDPGKGYRHAAHHGHDRGADSLQREQRRHCDPAVYPKGHCAVARRAGHFVRARHLGRQRQHSAGMKFSQQPAKYWTNDTKFVIL